MTQNKNKFWRWATCRYCDERPTLSGLSRGYMPRKIRVCEKHKMMLDKAEREKDVNG